MSVSVSGTGETTVLLVDDHEVLIESLAISIEAEDDLHVVGIATTVQACRELMERFRPDVVLLDAKLGDDDGIAEIPRLREIHPNARIVVLSGMSADRFLLAAVEAGAAGFVTKSAPLGEVVDAVRTAAAGEVALSPQVLGRLLTLVRQPAAGRPTQLTARELEVLQLVAQGLSNAAIAETLFIGVNTVRNHISSLSAKLGAHSKLEVLSLALKAGLVEDY